jgi:hypothetical protein
MDWICLVQDSERWRALVIINLQVSELVTVCVSTECKTKSQHKDR